MSDNWSSSVLTLAGAGDWCKWSFDVPDSIAADDLNGASAGIYEGFRLRGALTAPSETAALAIMVNDVLAKIMFLNPMPEPVYSTGSWISADRFGEILTYAVQGFSTVDFPAQGAHAAFVDIGIPFVVGTNTIRLLSFGLVAIEIDFFEMQSGGGGYIAFNLGDDSHAESAPPTFAGHVNPNPFSGGSGSRYSWLLKAPDAATGSAAESTLDVLKYCPAGPNTTAKVRVTGGGLPVAGTVGVWPDGTVATLDGAGEATFAISGHPGGCIFWYGGSDAWAPRTADANSDIGCGGWYVGQIGMG